MQIEMGMPVILKDATGLEAYNLFKGQCGMVNSVIVIEEEEYIYFMPESQLKIYAIKSTRVEVDVDKLETFNEEEEADEATD